MSIALLMHLLTAASVACAATAASALVPLATSRYRGVEVFDGDAIGSAQALRKVFDERFSQPRESHPDRFSWDPWHVTRRAEYSVQPKRKRLRATRGRAPRVLVA